MAGMIPSQALSGRVIGFLPEHFAQHWEDKAQLRKLNKDVHRYASPFVIMTRVGKQQSALQKLFVAKLKQHCQNVDDENGNMASASAVAKQE